MDDRLRLRNQTCFALYSASRAVTGAYRPLLDELGLTYPQLLVLLALWESDGQTVSELGTALHLDSGTLSPLVKRLEAAGLVSRRRDQADERKVTVALTQAGRELQERAQQVPRVVAEKTGISPQEMTTLRDILTTIIESIPANTERSDT